MRVATVQFDPHIGDTEHNLEAIEQRLAKAGAHGVELAIFPECAVSGYVFGNLEEAREIADAVPGRASERIAAAAATHGVYAVIGMLERVGDAVYNSAILVGPHGFEGVYRKTHTLCMGVDRFSTPGNIPYQVHDLPIGRLGILICYDVRFPEPARALALAGAQMIAVPTNWPSTSTIQPDVFTRSRAAENHVFLLAANRVGQERGTQFLGRSQIVSPMGEVLAEGDTESEALLIRDIEPAQADFKHVVVSAGEHEMDCFSDRRPELYGTLLREGLTAEVR